MVKLFCYEKEGCALVALRGFLFCFSAARSLLFAFLPIYLYSWRITPFQLGCLFGAKQLTSMILLPPLMNLIGKIKHRASLVFLLGLFAFSGVSIFVCIADPYQGDNSLYCGESSFLKPTNQISTRKPKWLWKKDRKRTSADNQNIPLPSRHKPIITSNPFGFGIQEQNESEFSSAVSNYRNNYQNLVRHTKVGPNSVPAEFRNTTVSTVIANSFPVLTVSQYYVWVFCVVLISDVFLTAIQFIADDSLWNFLEAKDLLSYYKKVKRWDALGSFVGSFVICLMINFGMCHLTSANPFLYHVACSTVFVIFAAGMIFFYPFHSFTASTYRYTAIQNSAKLLLCNIQHSPYTLIAFLIGFLTFGFDVVQLWYLRDVEAPVVLLALILVIQNLLEIVFKFILDSWETQSQQYHWMFSLAVFTAGIQSLAYCYTKVLIFFILVEFLYAFRHTLAFNALEAFTEYIAPPEIKRDARFIILSIYLGPGMGLGSFYAGSVYDFFGTTAFYQIHTLLTFILLVIFFPLKFAIPHRASVTYEKHSLIEMSGSPHPEAHFKALLSDMSDDSVETSSYEDQCLEGIAMLTNERKNK
uniref:Major facilitator superfamily associated domain-containing protein n=1 Tax=Erpetoichthys calabaricus TaxID=27687 RepID=A0A8C4S637_ERPCA